MAELTGFTCVNAACEVEYVSDPGDCVCGATAFVRLDEVAESAPAPDGAEVEQRRCSREDCAAVVADGADTCPYCGTSLTPTESAPGRPCLLAADGTRVPLREGEAVVLGRDGAESAWARLAEGCPGVSRRHASITAWRGAVHVVDLGSTNGTWVNGIRIDRTAEVPLAAGMRIGLGRGLELVVSSA